MMNSKSMDWIGDWAGQRRRLTPEREAVIEPVTGRCLNYRDLDERACRLADWMVSVAGLTAGDVVVLISENRLEALDVCLACGKTGVVLAPVSHKLKPAEATALIERLQPRYLIGDAALADFISALSGQVPAIPQLRFGQGVTDYQHQVESRAVCDRNQALSLSDPYLLVHTGGSTGLPKICRVSHAQMQWNAIELLVAATDGLGRRRELLLFPLFHIGGWNTVLPILYAGGCLILQPHFEADQALRLIDDYQVNHFGAVEAMLRAMADAAAFQNASLATLAGITTAGAPCAAATMAPFFDRGIPVSQAYGSTEAGPSNFINPRDGVALDTLQDEHDSIGTALFHCDYRIVDPQTLAPCPSGTAGELQMRSPHAFDGYLDDPTRTQAIWTEDGWLRSGDIACEDDNGKIKLVGRIDNMIVSGGENIAAEELEALLTEYPGVEAALVFGVPDAQWGARPVAWVVGPKPAEAGAINDWLAARIARFKCPAAIEMVDALPRTGAGKIDRQAAKQRYEQTMGKGAT